MLITQVFKRFLKLLHPHHHHPPIFPTPRTQPYDVIGGVGQGGRSREQAGSAETKSQEIACCAEKGGRSVVGGLIFLEL